jgi:hypothetical protein
MVNKYINVWYFLLWNKAEVFTFQVQNATLLAGWGPSLLKEQKCVGHEVTNFVLLYLNSMAWVRKKTILTEQPLLVGKVIAKHLRIESATWSARRIPTAVSRFSRQEPLLLYQVAPQLYSWGWVDPVPDPLLFFPGSAGNRTRASGSVAKNSGH